MLEVATRKKSSGLLPEKHLMVVWATGRSVITPITSLKKSIGLAAPIHNARKEEPIGAAMLLFGRVQYLQCFRVCSLEQIQIRSNKCNIRFNGILKP